MKKIFNFRQLSIVFPLLIIFVCFIYVLLNNLRSPNNLKVPTPGISNTPVVKLSATPVPANYPTIIPVQQFLPPYSMVQSETISSDVIVATNAKNLLVIYRKNASNGALEPTVISKSAEIVYGHSGSLIAYIEKSNPKTLKVYDIKTGNIINSVNVEAFLPVSSINISPDNKYLVFLGNYNLINRKSSVYSLNISDKLPTTLFSTFATEVVSLPNNFLLLFTSQDALDKSAVIVINRNPPQNIVIDIPHINFYHLSPNHIKLLTQSDTRIQISNFSDGSTTSLQILPHSLSAWVDDQTIIVMERNNTQLILSLINGDNMQKTKTFKITYQGTFQINQITGVIDNQILLTDFSGRSWTIDIPKN
jgi:hypothetical protein